MQYPPHGGGYGPPQYPGGYGGPPPFPYGGAPPPRPPRSGSNGAVIALVVIVGVLVLGGGGCLVCGILAGMSSSATVAATGDASAPPLAPASAAESTLDRTPTAVALEGALKKDGVPLDHVECPISPPTPNAFSCAVLPANEGDPAEVTVTLGPTGMAYKLQEGFVILEGTKLASTFAGITARGGAPQMTVPCFTGKILKHADTSFTCEVVSRGQTVGYVTTDVVGTSGQVKMTYKAAPTGGAGSGGGGGAGTHGGAAPSPSAAMGGTPSPTAAANPTATPTTGSNGALDGNYACLVSRYQGSPSGLFNVVHEPSTLPRFTISGGTYTSGGTTGRIAVSGQVVSFLGGAYDGWQGLLASNTTPRYILFRSKTHGDAQPGTGVKIGDSQCYVQKS